MVTGEDLFFKRLCENPGSIHHQKYFSRAFAASYASITPVPDIVECRLTLDFILYILYTLKYQIVLSVSKKQTHRKMGTQSHGSEHSGRQTAETKTSSAVFFRGGNAGKISKSCLLTEES
jgi:hypothetical protein